MAAEDNLRTELGKLLLQVAQFPRPSIRERLLRDIIAYCEKQSGMKK